MKYTFIILLVIISIFTSFFAFNSLSTLLSSFIYLAGFPWSQEIHAITFHFTYRSEIIEWLAKNSYVLGALLNLYIFYWLGKALEVFWERKQYTGMVALIVIFIGFSFGFIFGILDKYIINFLVSVARLF